MLQVKKTVSLVSSLNRLVRLKSCKKSDELVHCSTQNAAALCQNHRESRDFELAHWKKKKKKISGLDY